MNSKLEIESLKLLVVSLYERDSVYLQDFFERTDIPKPKFVSNQFVASDQFDFIVFDARSLPSVRDVTEFANLPGDVQNFFFLLDTYLRDTTKYVVYFGKYYHNLNQERCPSANSKFTLFARIRELIDFMNHYKI